MMGNLEAVASTAYGVKNGCCRVDVNYLKIKGLRQTRLGSIGDKPRIEAT